MAKKKAKVVKKVKETAVKDKVDEILETIDKVEESVALVERVETLVKEIDETVFRFDGYGELIAVLTSVQVAPDNAVVRYRVTKDAPSDQATAVVVDGVVCVHPQNVRSFITQAPSFHYEHVDD